MIRPTTLHHAQACAAQGLGELDHSALVQALEIMAEHPVAKG
ncbi:hypothetical protein [uncultured Hydrogenophaga sp.]|nr:hypothetical protein [uncultured Hydrogenophaga sp.]